MIYPTPPGDTAPKVERLDDLTIRVTDGKQVDVISFDAKTTQPASVIVDLAAIAPAGLHAP